MKKKAAATTARQRTAILVLGMHRSGTSALARIVNLLGAAAPNTLMPADPTNPRGFWESNKLVPINEGILAAMGSSWDDWLALDPAWSRRAEAPHFLELLKDGITAEFGEARLFVIKDPRICRMLPLWLDALNGAGAGAVAYHIIRNPLEVAASLRARNGFATGKSLMLWLRNVLDAEKDSRQLPRAFLSYERLLSDWRGALTTAGKASGMPWPAVSPATSAEISEFLSDDLRRNRASTTDVASQPDVLVWVRDAYGQLQKLIADPADAGAKASLDGIKAAFDTACVAFGMVADSDKKSVKEREQRLASANERVSAVEAALRQTSRDLNRATGDVATAQARAREREQALQREVARADALAARAQSAESLAGDLQKRVEATAARVAELEPSLAQVSQLEQQSKQFQERAQALDTKLAETTKQLAVLQSELLTSERSRAQSSVDLARANARIVEHERTLKRSDDEIAALRNNVVQLQARLDQMLQAQAAIQADQARSATELTSVLAQARGLASVLEEKHAEVRELEGEVNGLRHTLSEYETQAKKSERQIAELKGAMTQSAAQAAARDARLKTVEAEAARERDERARETAGREAIETSARAAMARAGKAENELAAAAAKIAALEARLGSWSGIVGSAMKRAAAVMPQRASGARNVPPLDEQARAIAKANLFDAPWYLAQNGDVRAAGVDPLIHYVEFGWKEGRDPNPHFSTGKYLDANPSVRQSGICPLYHYAIVGRLERRSPQGGSVEPDQNDAAALVGAEFDSTYYQQKYAAALRGQEPLAHFLQYGWRKGFDPHAYFSVGDYLKIYPDVRAAGVNPYVHYLLAGRREGRVPRREPHHTEDFLEQRRVIAAEFDVAFYLARYPDVKAAWLDPIEHFMQSGWSEGRDPTPAFSTAYYLAVQHDVRDASVNPFYHFLVAGRGEGRQPLPTEQDRRWHDVRDAVATRFDSDFYLATYSDVAAAGVDPLDHYLNHGTAERRDPTPLFSTGFYLDANPDVAEAGVNPFYHYVVAGKAEGRKAMHPGGWRANALARLQPVEKQIEEAASYAAAPSDLEFGDLTAKLDAAIAQSDRRITVALSHDDYTTSVGGVQLCLKLEEDYARSRRGIYLNLHPATPMPFLSRERTARNTALTIVCNGESWGTASASAIANALRGARPKLAACDLTVHSLLGHAPEVIVELHRAMGARKALFWVHDFFSVCPSYTLLRNGISFCGAPGAGSAACSLCVYGEERISHLRRMSELFAAVPFDVVAPSSFAAEFWREHGDLPHQRLIVQPHCTIEPDAAFVPGGGTRERAARIAFLGHPAPHKGWETFVRLADRLAGDERYEFHHFGSGRKCLRGTEFTHVSVLEDGPNAMIDALRAKEIDAAVLWSVWPETFSFVAHEAIAAGALILTCAESGNIARVARGRDRGLVYQSDDDLAYSFESGLVWDLTMERRNGARTFGQPRFGRMSFELLGAEPERVP